MLRVNQATQTSRSRTQDRAFVLDENKLRELVTLLVDSTNILDGEKSAPEGANKVSIGQRLSRLINRLRGALWTTRQGPPETGITYNIEFVDNQSITTGNIDDVLGIKNTNVRKITGITVHAFANNNQNSLISFRDNDYVSTYYSVSGPESYVAIVPARLEEFIEGITPWYSPVVKYAKSVWAFMAAYASVIAFGVLVFVMGPSIIKSIRTIASITSGVSDLL